MKKFLSFILCSACCLAAAAQGHKLLPDGFPDLAYYVDNLEVYEVGQEDGRAYHIPEEHLSLNGTWHFSYYDTPLDVPHDFFKPSYNDRKWGRIEVPSNWEMQGYGQALFRNITTPYPLRLSGNDDPFAVEVPFTPMDYNPTGAYRTSFDVPRGWKGKEVFLRFEKVASASFVWVNGTLVGYNEGAQEPSEYDVTAYVKPGKNQLAVLVLKYCDGYYLESQDYWRLAGIFDDVTVYATPQARIWDWQVVTDFGPDYGDSDLSVDVDMRSYAAGAGSYRLEAAVSREGKAVARMAPVSFTVAAEASKRVSFREKVIAPLKWSSETPDLYDLTLTLKDADGRTVDTVTKKIGFKKTEIRDGVFYLNGQPLKVSAQCSHMQHPELGHRMTEDVVRRDMEILKRFNFNGVRTSHYPPVNKYLELADEYGLYIIDETGDESHATEFVSDMPGFAPMYRERVRRMVLRDRNHACVLFWSAGNESGEGPNITEVVREGKRLDPTRFWMYGGNARVHPAEDIIGPRYPAPLEHEISCGIDSSDMRPSFMDEYLSVAGNGGGGMDDYWNEIYAHPRLMGGAIWDFVSVGVTEPVRALEDRSPAHTPAHVMGRAKLVKGPSGQALDLYRQDQWVQVYRSDAVEIDGDRLTLTLDVFPRKFNRSGGYLITKGAHQYGLRQHRDNLEFYIDTGKTTVLSAPLPSGWEGRWHQVAAVYDGTAMKLFIDGKEIASQGASGRIRNLPLSVCIGRNEEIGGQETNEYICDALIDNVGIFADAVLPSEGFDPARAALWLDFEKETDEGTFWSYGVGARTYGSVWPDRTPQPEMWQMKKSTQPLKFTLLDMDGNVEVWNRNHFLDASYYKVIWKLLADGDILAEGELPVSVAPLSRGRIHVPFEKPRIEPGKEYRLEMDAVLRNDEIWAPAGYEVAWDQFDLTAWNEPAEVAPVSGKVSLQQEGILLCAYGENFRYGFDSVAGTLVSVKYDGREMLTRPLDLNVWRAPLSNELDGWNSWGAGKVPAEGYGSIGHGNVLAGHYYAAFLDRCSTVPVSVLPREVGDAVVIDVRNLVLLGNGVSRQLDTYIFGKSYSGFEQVIRYRIDGGGVLTVEHSIRPQGTMPAWLPRIGVTMGLEGSLSMVSWYGRGPEANYPDRKTGYRMGVYEKTVEDMYEPYLIPQDYGLRTDIRWVRFADGAGQGVEFRMNEPFAFNAYPFTTDNLTKAVYPYQLQRSGDITVNLDYATSGVGCTARGIFPSYRVYPGLYERVLTIRPIR